MLKHSSIQQALGEMALGFPASGVTRLCCVGSDAGGVSRPSDRMADGATRARNAGLLRRPHPERVGFGSEGMANVAPGKHVLVGNAFPLSLVTRRVVIEPASVQDLQVAATDSRLHSFWGHANTLAAAQEAMGIAFTPETERPVLVLDEEGYPSLDGMSFEECWIVTPVYVDTFRPKVGEEVPLALIRDWRVLRMRWQDA